MDALVEKAKKLLLEFKGTRYAFGAGALAKVGPMTAEFGRRALVVGRVGSAWFGPTLENVLRQLDESQVEIAGVVQGADPNTPRQDVGRLKAEILAKKPDVIVSVESGSGIDGCKAAAALASFDDMGAELDSLFGSGKVSELCQRSSRQVLPVIAVMTAAGSAAHLTRYSNVSDMESGQKKLIIDEAITPPRAVFDYSLTKTSPEALTLDGGLDGVSHCLEVYLGANGDGVGDVEEISLAGIELVMRGLRAIMADGSDFAARELIALGTDLGGYSVMKGGTNGPHLNSFSMVKYLSHGRACALMLPYYIVFFAPAVEDRIRRVGGIYKKLGVIDCSLDGLAGRELGLAVGEGMMAFSRSVGLATKLSEVANLDRGVLDTILRAAKKPELASKLENMPVPMSAETVDTYMGSVLEAAWDGDLNKIARR